MLGRKLVTVQRERRTSSRSVLVALTNMSFCGSWPTPLQLEASVTTLTETLNDLRQRGFDEPSSLRCMALEAENNQLRHENAQLRQENSYFRDQLADAVRSTPPRALVTPPDDHSASRDSYKRRKRSADESFLASAYFIEPHNCAFSWVACFMLHPFLQDFASLIFISVQSWAS